MTILWAVIAIASLVLILLVSTVVSMWLGRGHLGVDQSQRHYLDECESMYHWNGF